MGVREAMNRRPKLFGAVAAAFLVAAVGVALFQMFDLHAAPRADGGDVERAFFTVDEGKTWFVDAASRLPPFDHDGKQAVRAYIVACGGKKLVNHLERYTPEGKRAMAQLQEVVKKGPPSGALVAAAQMRGREVKRPGDAKWTPSGDTAAAAAITSPRCPDGTSSDATFVFP